MKPFRCSERNDHVVEPFKKKKGNKENFKFKEKKKVLMYFDIDMIKKKRISLKTEKEEEHVCFPPLKRARTVQLQYSEVAVRGGEALAPDVHVHEEARDQNHAAHSAVHP